MGGVVMGVKITQRNEEIYHATEHTNESWDSISDRYGVSAWRVRQIHDSMKVKDLLNNGLEAQFGSLVEAKDLEIAWIGFSVRSVNALLNANLRTLGEVAAAYKAGRLNITYDKYRNGGIKNFGKKSLAEVEGILSEYGLLP
jgi:DNA-directed RNA polymerase alpha subunit